MSDLNAHYRTVLKAEYESRLQKNELYSQNAYARSLGVDNTYLSKLMSGKILLSLDLADLLTAKLKLTKEERAKFLLSAAEEQKCHALYLIDPSLTDCSDECHETNVQPLSRKK